MKCSAMLPALLLGLNLLPAQADSNTERTWHLAYQKVLTAYSRMQGFEVKSADDPYGARWDLCDIDGDGIPELFISPDDSHVNGVMIYTCISGNPVLLQCGYQQAFGENGLTAVNTDAHIVGSFRTGQGVEQRTFYKVENGKLVELDSFMSDIESYPDGEKSHAVWELNKHNVTKDRYDAAYEPYTELVWTEVGREYAFIDRSPLAAVKRSLTAGDPPDMQKAALWGGVAALIAAVCSAVVSLIWRRQG